MPVALATLARGGVLDVAGIRPSDIPVLAYDRHLFHEKCLLSVTANARRDGRDFLEVAPRIDLSPTTHPHPFDRADAALDDLANGRFTGTAVLTDFDR